MIELALRFWRRFVWTESVEREVFSILVLLRLLLLICVILLASWGCITIVQDVVHLWHWLRLPSESRGHMQTLPLTGSSTILKTVLLGSVSIDIMKF